MDNKTITVASIIALLILLFVAIAYFYPLNKTSEQAKEVKFDSILQGSETSLKVPGSLVIRNQQGWSDFTSKLISSQLPSGTPDFNNKIAIAVMMGEQMTGGYEIEIVRIDEFPDKVQVGVVKRTPGDNCINTQSITAPFQLVEIDKTNKPIEFSYTTNKVNC